MYLPNFRTYYAERKVNNAYDPPLDWKHIMVVIFMLVIYYLLYYTYTYILMVGMHVNNDF